MKPKLWNLIEGNIFCLFILISLFPIVSNSQTKTESDETPVCSLTAGAEDKKEISELEKLPQYRYIVSENVADFVKRLNEFGKCGYRLDNLTKVPLRFGKKFGDMNLAAILKLDAPNTYEYDWFEAFTHGEITTRLNYRMKKGFRLRDSIHSVEESFSPTTPSSDDPFDAMLTTIFDRLRVTVGKLFILERKNNAVVKLEDSRVIIGRWGWGKSPTKELQQNLDVIIGEGFSPIEMGFGSILTKSYFFLIMVKDGTNLRSTEKSDLTYKIIKTEFNFEKKVNRLAQEGFKIIFYENLGVHNFVIMAKEEQSTESSSYHFVDVTKKNWQESIKNLAQQGAVYKRIGMNYVNYYSGGFEGTLVFEKSLIGNKKSVEYKTLKMSKDFKPNKPNDSPDLLVTSEETMAEFTRTLKEGFIARELFFSDGIHVLFERMK